MAETTDPAEPAHDALGGVSVVTATQGRHDALLALHASLGRSRQAPRQLVVVAVDDDELISWQPEDGVPATVVPLSETTGGVWWSRAKNAGATTAMLEGALVVVFVQIGHELDADALGALARACGQQDGLWWAEVEGAGGADGSDPEPEPADGELPSATYAVSAGAWGALGGLVEQYAGAGYEDADLALAAREHGLAVGRAEGAVVRRVAEAGGPAERDRSELARNAELFVSRWHTDPPARGGGW